MVAKRAASPYRSGPKRTDDWVKIKSERDDEFVVIGLMAGKGTRGVVGALCVASYSGDKLVYTGACHNTKGVSFAWAPKA